MVNTIIKSYEDKYKIFVDLIMINNDDINLHALTFISNMLLSAPDNKKKKIIDNL